MSYNFLSHTADLKVLVKEKNIKTAFSNSASALKEAICGKIKIKPKIIKKFSVKGEDFEGLLYNFLEEFLFLLDAKSFLFSRIEKLKFDDENFKILAEVSGDKAENYKFSNPVKAITYNDMFVGRKGKSFICRFVLDV
jgi:SHS2 domain-containing protein